MRDYVLSPCSVSNAWQSSQCLRRLGPTREGEHHPPAATEYLFVAKTSFGLRPQPEFDEPADGLGATWLVFLHGGPGIDRRDQVRRHPHANERILAGGRSTRTTSLPPVQFRNCLFQCDNTLF